ncbi:MAG: serine--tRNA ligase [Acidobacteria bacterium]|nr:serine--tRNA ligase [Acidobacteriota bacterium]MCA1627259.1 serine--tRNA ligase [Acidobacteriota bacterium]
MLDLNYVRENTDKVREALEARRADTTALDDFARADEERRRTIAESDQLNAQRNASSREIGALMKEGKKEEADARRAEVGTLKERIAELDQLRAQTEARMNDLLSSLPNIPHDSVPRGESEADNVEVRRWGTAPEFNFEPKDHVDLGAALGILDLERAAKISAARFAILNGAGARLERALINFMLDVHTREHGYKETLPPFIVNRSSLFGTAQLPKFEADLFKLQDERELYLIPTAEVPVTNYHREEILDATQLPFRWCAYTPCFRSEAGSYGRDTRGVIRQHQFEKVELVKYALPENSYEELESLTRDAETILQRLNLHYRVVTLSTADIGFGAAKTYDLEVWLPSQNTFREISSCSNYEAFQARRAQIRFRRAGGSKPEFVHTLNGSGLAIGRTWIAILENYQQEDGSVIVPGVLKPYMGGIDVLDPI